MKKTVTLILCAVMMLSAVLTVFAVDEEPFGIRFIKSSAYGWLFSEKERIKAAEESEKPAETEPQETEKPAEDRPGMELSHPENTSLPMEVTLFGIVILVRPLQL